MQRIWANCHSEFLRLVANDGENKLDTILRTVTSLLLTFCFLQYLEKKLKRESLIIFISSLSTRLSLRNEYRASAH